LSYYQYFLIVITLLALSEALLISFVKPYYLKKLKGEGSEASKLPELAFEIFYLVIVIFSLAVSQYLFYTLKIEVSSFAIMGAIFLCYGVFSRLNSFSFYLLSALIFNIYRKKSFEQQLYWQGVIITIILCTSGVSFLTLSIWV